MLCFWRFCFLHDEGILMLYIWWRFDCLHGNWISNALFLRKVSFLAWWRIYNALFYKRFGYLHGEGFVIFFSDESLDFLHRNGLCKFKQQLIFLHGNKDLKFLLVVKDLTSCLVKGLISLFVMTNLTSYLVKGFIFLMKFALPAWWLVLAST